MSRSLQAVQPSSAGLAAPRRHHGGLMDGACAQAASAEGIALVWRRLGGAGGAGGSVCAVAGRQARRPAVLPSTAVGSPAVRRLAGLLAGPPGCPPACPPARHTRRGVTAGPSIASERNRLAAPRQCWGGGAAPARRAG